MPAVWLRKSVALVVFVLCGASTPPAYADERLIAHPDVSTSAITLNTTRLIFSMQLGRWPDGTPVRVFVLPDDSDVHRSFSKDLLRLYPRQLRRVWDRQLYSGTGQAPETVADLQAMRRRVASTPGAIGYLSDEMIDESVHVLTIE